jgi:hypothetical protein
MKPSFTPDIIFLWLFITAKHLIESLCSLKKFAKLDSGNRLQNSSVKDSCISGGEYWRVNSYCSDSVNIDFDDSSQKCHLQ